MLEVADDLWTHEAQIREVILPFIGIPMLHRMTVVRLSTGEILLHSPTHLGSELCARINELGEVSAIIAPSWWHDLHLAEALSLYPRAQLFVTPSLLASKHRLPMQPLGDAPAPLWSGQIEQTRIQGIALHFDEFVFYHRESRSLILADLLASDDGFVGGTLRAVVRVASGAGCSFPRIFRAAVFHRKEFRASLQRILEWDFDRIIIGHGSITETGGKAVFRTSFDWIL